MKLWQYVLRGLSVLMIAFVSIGGTSCGNSGSNTTDPANSNPYARRSYIVRIPISYDSSTPVALVFVLHGYTGNASGMEQYTQFTVKAGQEGFMVVYPNGVGNAWNIGGTTVTVTNNADDVGFIAYLIDTLSAQYAIDPKRVFVTGHSNGGMMAYRLAIELPERIAAIAPVAGPMLSSFARPTQPVSVLHIHGLADNVVPYNGGTLFGSLTYLAVEKTMATWAQTNSCDAQPVTIAQQGNVVGRQWNSAIGQDVALYTIRGWGHDWPNQTNAGLLAVDVIWEFFRTHPKQ